MSSKVVHVLIMFATLYFMLLRITAYSRKYTLKYKRSFVYLRAAIDAVLAMIAMLVIYYFISSR